MLNTSGLSGNEIYCLQLKNFSPGPLVVGNSVQSLGLLGSVGSSFKAILGGELQQITSLIEEGRELAYQRMLEEAKSKAATGITSVTSQLIVHGANVEFLSIGSVIRAGTKTDKFTSSADGQELFAQLDAGYKPICFAFGNVAYSMGLRRGIMGTLKTWARGEIKEFSEIFNHTRHLALNRICSHARKYKANAVLGIKTTVLPFSGINEMLMLGTASYNPQLVNNFEDKIASSDMTNIEMWNMAQLGYRPLKLLLGTSVYSLGFVGGLSAAFKSFVRGEINELTRLIYQAREHALALIEEEAKAIEADEVIGVKTYVYQLGNGLIEFLAIGTAVKKDDSIKTQSKQLPPQAVVADQNTFYDSTQPDSLSININQGAKPINKSILPLFIPLLISLFLILHWLLR